MFRRSTPSPSRRSPRSQPAARRLPQVRPSHAARRVAVRERQPGPHQVTIDDPGPRHDPDRRHRGYRAAAAPVPLRLDRHRAVPLVAAGYSTRADGGLDVAVTVTNAGSARGRAQAAGSSASGVPDFRDYVFFTQPIAPGEHSTFTQSGAARPGQRSRRPSTSSSTHAGAAAPSCCAWQRPSVGRDGNWRSLRRRSLSAWRLLMNRPFVSAPAKSSTEPR